MPKFKVINPDTPEEIDLVQDIPLVDEETGLDQIDSEGNILVKRYVTRTVNLNGINAVKDSLPQIKENAKNLKDLYDYSHSVNTDQQNQILENSSKITELLTDTTALEVTVTELENKIKGIQGIDIDEVKADLDALKQSAYLITGGTLKGDISVQTPHTATVTLNPSGSSSSASFSCTNDMLECTSTWGKLFKQSEEGGFFYGLSSTALADKNGKELTNYISDIMGSNAQLTFIKGDGTSQVISINNVISATKATQDGNGDVIANTYIKSINGVKADANGNIELAAGDSNNARLRFEDIGIAGQKGFGQSACSDEVRVKELGFRALQGTVNPDSDNYYGVYEHEYAGLCCYIPKFWVRIGNENAPQYSIYKNNSIEIASGDTFSSEDEAKTQGYFLPRAFIDGGEIKRGFFLQKYNSRASSSNRADGKNYPTSYITNSNIVSITLHDMIDRAKLLGDNWNVATCFMLAAHQLLTLSLAQMAEWYTWCKWYKPTQNYQYPTIGLSATNEGLYTHNGMPNGIAGLSYVWQLALGITTAGTSATQGQTIVTSNDIYILKKEKSFTELTSGFGGDTDAWGTSSSLLSMYDKHTSPLTLTINRSVKWGNGEYDVLTNGYNKDSGEIVELDRALCGVIPKNDNAVSANGSNQMASSLIYQEPTTQNLAFLFGGETVSGHDKQPCFSRNFNNWRTRSGSLVGFRCGCYA